MSAVLSALAVVGVTAALVIQIRQVKTTQAQGMRLMQLELMKMLANDLTLRPLSTDAVPPGAGEGRRRNIYTNLVLKYLELGYETGYFTGDSLQVELRENFRVDHIRGFWQAQRINRFQTAANKAQRQFIEMVDEVYRSTVPSAITRSRAVADAQPRAGQSWGGPAEWISVAAVAVACGVSAALIRRRARASGRPASRRRRSARRPDDRRRRTTPRCLE